jgi:predicted component of type VI protein secretion system
MTEKTVRDTITINDKEFFVDELDETQVYYLNQVRSLRARIAEARFNLDQLQAAENAFSSALTSSTVKDEVTEEVKESA